MADPNNLKNIKKESAVSRIPGSSKFKGNGRSPKERKKELEHLQNLLMHKIIEDLEYESSIK